MAKKAAQTAARAALKVPSLLTPPSYKPFLDTVMSARENKKILASQGKAVVDSEYRRLLNDVYNEGKANELFKEVK